MELKQHLGGRFYAALYRWNTHAHSLSLVRRVSSRTSTLAHLSSRRATRNYTVTTLCRQSESSNLANDCRSVATAVSTRAESSVDDIKSPQQPISEQAQTSTSEGRTKLNVQAQSLRKIVRESGHEADILRKIMRQVPSSVVILTVAAIDPETKKHIPVGTALSSFNTVSLDPPHVSFNIKHPSQTLNAIRAAEGRFRISFLDDDPSSAKIVSSFSKGNTKDAFEERHKAADIILNGDNESYAPEINSSRLVADLDCELTQEIGVADHVVLIAKVNSIYKSVGLRSTLAYHDGFYKQCNAISFMRMPNISNPSSPYSQMGINSQAPWWTTYPVLYGSTERQHFLAKVQEVLSNDPESLTVPAKDVNVRLKYAFNIPDNTFGINLINIIKDHQIRSGIEQQDNSVGNIYYDFYGRLTPTNIRKIVQRAVKLIEAKPSTVNLPVISFFDLLSVHPRSKGILASEILDSLGTSTDLPVVSDTKAGEGGVKPWTLRDAASFETKLRNFFKNKKSFIKLFKTHSSGICAAVGEKHPYGPPYVDRVRLRIIDEVFPGAFSAPHIDLRGEVTREEALVAVSRILGKVLSGGIRANIAHIKEYPVDDYLRQLKIHPSISGFDLDFFLHMLRQLRHDHGDNRNLRRAIGEMVEPMFTSKRMSWEDVVLRVRQLVETHTMQVLKWSRNDIIAAMGINRYARLWTPLTPKNPSQFHTSKVLTPLISMELKKRYGHGTPEENEAIASYLERKHGYSIKKAGGETEEASRKRLMHNLGITVTPEQAGRQEIEEAIEEFGLNVAGVKRLNLKENKVKDEQVSQD